ncbi:metal-sensing transcriptional repressor [Streptomyces sp. NPDC006476]|uniref:metal-sensing transcriptional repressor n=1 Tax=Streptomyces sp. NPDC006476 TaxID=3157175 RepID=UPI0033A90086
MVDEDRYCIDVLTQIGAVTRAPAGGRPGPARRTRQELRVERRPFGPGGGGRESRRTRPHHAPGGGHVIESVPRRRSFRRRACAGLNRIRAMPPGGGTGRVLLPARRH